MKTTKDKILQIGIGNTLYTLHNATDLASNGHITSQNPIYYKDMEIDYKHVEDKNPLGGGFAMIASTMFQDFSNYKIVHMLSQHPASFRKREEFILITTAHEIQCIQFPEYNSLAAQSFKGFLWQESVTKPGITSMFGSDYICATSQLIKKGLIEKGFPKNDIFMTPLGLAPEFLEIPIEKVEHEDFRAGVIGTAGPQKNTEFAISAVKSLPTIGNYRFEIWGNSIYSQAKLDNMIGQDSRIKVMGPAPDSWKVNLYDSFDVVLYPSRYEGWGLGITEAKARGIPVIIWKDGKISPEVRKYCFEADSPEEMADIISQLKENGYNKKQRKMAIEDARQYTLERTGKSILSAYKNVLDGEF